MVNLCSLIYNVLIVVNPQLWRIGWQGKKDQRLSSNSGLTLYHGVSATRATDLGRDPLSPITLSPLYTKMPFLCIESKQYLHNFPILNNSLELFTSLLYIIYVHIAIAAFLGVGSQVSQSHFCLSRCGWSCCLLHTRVWGTASMCMVDSGKPVGWVRKAYITQYCKMSV